MKAKIKKTLKETQKILSQTDPEPVELEEIEL